MSIREPRRRRPPARDGVKVATTTTVGGSYSRYVREWADAVAAQTRRPDQIVIVDNGADDPAAVARAAAKVGAELIVMPWTVNYGRARNVGIAATSTGWVQHADVDDLMYPHALADTVPLTGEADVVGWGWDRVEHRRRRQRIYGTHQGPASLATLMPASGLSPFRRELWEQSPYRDDLPSGWDTALWRGFGHLGARFVGTPRPVFGYRWHPDSLFHSRFAAGDPQQVGVTLGRLAKRWPDETVVVVPWRDQGCPHRQAAWDWCRTRWEAYGLPVVTADVDGEWNKPAALNAAVADLDCRTVIVADADVMIPPDRVAEAVRIASYVPWVMPHTRTVRLDADATASLLDGAGPGRGRVMDPYPSVAGGGLFVMSRAQWRRTGGMDPEFRGWGAEDEAFAVVADGVLGPHVRLDGDLTHLYHPPGLRTSHPRWEANAALFRQYRRAARTSRAELIRMLKGRPHTAVVRDARAPVNGRATLPASRTGDPRVAEGPGPAEA